MTEVSNADQREFWTSQAGPKWVVQQEALDHHMQPVLDGVLARANLQKGHRVLDVGCGTGTSTMQAARLVAEGGHVFGVDISSTLLDLARQRAAGIDNVAFTQSDAATHGFDAQGFDHLISRFGVMFFGDPALAFANMSRGLKPGASITFAAWGQIPNNPFFILPAQVARGIVGAPPKPDPDGPGPFAFRDPERVLAILTDAGLKDASCEVVNMALTPKGTVQDFADLSMYIGPADAACTHFDATEEQRAAVHAGLVEAFSEFDTDNGLRIPAEINFFTALAS